MTRFRHMVKESCSREMSKSTCFRQACARSRKQAKWPRDGSQQVGGKEEDWGWLWEWARDQMCHGRSLVFYSKDVGKQPECWHGRERLNLISVLWEWLCLHEDFHCSKSRGKACSASCTGRHGRKDDQGWEPCGTSAGGKSEHTGWQFD